MSATGGLRTAEEATTEHTTVPDDVGSSNAKLVYLYLYVTGASSVGEMSDALGMGKMALFSVLDSLSAGGHVEREDGTYALTE